MRAAVYERYGPPEVVHLADMPKPGAGANEVLIRVVATTVNRTDCGFRKAEPWIVRFFSGLGAPKRPILGNEVAGVVEAVGSGVTRFKAGDWVAGLTGDSFGAHAEYVCVRENAAIAATPAAVPLEQAVALWDGPWLALTCLRQARLAQGERILIYGASGSIGSSAVQLAKQHFGARVVAVCATNGLELVRSLGPDEVIDYTERDFTSLGPEFDVVLDAVGKSTFGACKRLLKPKGRFISTDLGPYWQNPFLQLWTGVTGGQRASLAIPDEKRTKDDVQFLRDLAEAGKLRPIVDRTYPLEQIVDAYRYVDSETKLGSVVIRVAS
jgi:NADPH:quinone reductase-like Zn-dependent oxidoreductase